MLKESTSGDFADKFLQLQTCRQKGSLTGTGDFTMTFLPKEHDANDTTMNPHLECPVQWRTTQEYNVILVEYSGVVLILNLVHAYAFYATEVVPGGNASVYRIPLKRLFECDDSFVPRSAAVCKYSTYNNSRLSIEFA